MPDLLDHISINVTNIAKAQTFYDPVLALLGYKVAFEFEGMLAYKSPIRDTTILLYLVNSPSPLALTQHVAFKVPSEAEVKEFYTVALASGGKDYGPPGLRLEYADNYYGAFILDLDGNNIEFVTRL
ncbi:Glyoxalase/Bleomycin resistance protein/Dihydroxybiphenyl dioxygenase [Limtongia smithiae]|uniref:Glyoxalase/Bleomycin resistance protein/Dihydroxybiphenyl dioxygenase n=1 Tax=Limtongia smithiae TaxID=1125753 RepID=UPI0034CD1FAD